MQHCGPPLSSIEVTAPRDPSLKQHAQLLLGRDNLLDSYSEWGAAVKKELTEMPETFELTPLVDEAMAGLRSVYRELLDIGLTDAIARCNPLSSALARINDAGLTGQPTLFKHQWSDDKTNISPTPLPVDAIRKLTDVSEGKIQRDSLISTNEPRGFNDAHTSLAYKRALRVLVVWLEHGGTDESVAITINQILEEDSDLTPLIDSLLSLTAVLAFLAAKAMGSTPQAIVGRFLDHLREE